MFLSILNLTKHLLFTIIQFISISGSIWEYVFHVFKQFDQCVNNFWFCFFTVCSTFSKELEKQYKRNSLWMTGHLNIWQRILKRNEEKTKNFSFYFYVNKWSSASCTTSSISNACVSKCFYFLLLFH